MLRYYFKQWTAFLFRDAKLFISFRWTVATNLASIGFAVATYYFLGETVSATLPKYSTNYFAFVIVGMAVSAFLMTTSVAVGNSIAQDMRSGALEFLMTTNSSPYALFSAMLAWPMAFGFATSVLYLGVGCFLFDLQLNFQTIHLGLLSLFLAGFCFQQISIVGALFVLCFKRGNPIQWLLNTLQVFLGGVYFPLSLLPDYLEWFGLLLPMHHALESVRQCLLVGASFADIQKHLAALLALGVITMFLAYFGSRWTVNHIKRSSNFLQH